MTPVKMDQRTYSEHWERESNNLGSQDIYQNLSQITPIAKTLEIGCGVGLGTKFLAANRLLMCIDNNPHLIQKATSYLLQEGVDVEVLKADVFELPAEVTQKISNFEPEGIVGWFIGSHPYDVDKHTPANTPPTERPLKYRQNIEDIIVGADICVDSVQWIHLANRVGLNGTYSQEQVFNATKDDYDRHLFKAKGFEVVGVQMFDWNREGSDFAYVNSHTSRVDSGQPGQKVVSILARRI